MSASVAGRHTNLVCIEYEDEYGPIYNVNFVPAVPSLIKEYLEAVQEIETERELKRLEKEGNNSGAW